MNWLIKKFHKCPEKIQEVRVSCHKYGDWPHYFVAINKDLIKEVRDLEPSERKAHVADISKVHETKAFHRELESMADQQVYFLAERALDSKQLSFGRGTINGIRLVQERFQALHSEHEEYKKPKEEFDPHEVFTKD